MKKMSKIVFEKKYYGHESLQDFHRDMYEALDPDYNEAIQDVPEEFSGTLTVTITYEPAEGEDEETV